MKKFFLNLVFFIPVALICYVLLLVGWGEIFEEDNHSNFSDAFHYRFHDNLDQSFLQNLNYPRGGFGYTYSRLQDAKRTLPKKILFLGSSFTYRGFDVGFLHKKGITSFNLGSSAQTPVQTEVLVNRYLDSIEPKLVIFEVSPGLFENEGIEASLDLIANDTIDESIIRMAKRTPHLKTFNTLVYGLYRQRYQRNDPNFVEEQRFADRYRKNGYVERRLKYNTPKKLPNRVIRVREKNLRAFERILDTLKARKIEYYLVMAPKTSHSYNRHLNLDTHIDYMKTKGPFINFQNTVPLDDSLHFYDPWHLNSKGVKLFNQKLIDTLQLLERWR